MLEIPTVDAPEIKPVESIPAEIQKGIDLVNSGNPAVLRSYLEEHPEARRHKAFLRAVGLRSFALSEKRIETATPPEDLTKEGKVEYQKKQEKELALQRAALAEEIELIMSIVRGVPAEGHSS